MRVWKSRRHKMLLWVKKFIKDFISMKGPVPFDKYEYIYNNLKTLLSFLRYNTTK